MTSISCLQSDVNYAMLQPLGIRLNWAGKRRVGNWFLMLFINSIFSTCQNIDSPPPTTQQHQRHKEHQNDTNNEILWWIPIADKKKERKNEREHRGKFIEKFRFGLHCVRVHPSSALKSSVLCAAKMNWIFFCPPDSIHPPLSPPIRSIELYFRSAIFIALQHQRHNKSMPKKPQFLVFINGRENRSNDERRSDSRESCTKAETIIR